MSISIRARCLHIQFLISFFVCQSLARIAYSCLWSTNNTGSLGQLVAKTKLKHKSVSLHGFCFVIEMCRFKFDEILSLMFKMFRISLWTPKPHLQARNRDNERPILYYDDNVLWNHKKCNLTSYLHVIVFFKKKDIINM